MLFQEMLDREIAHDFAKNNFNAMKTDIEKNENGYTVTVDLPGFSKEDVSVKLNEGKLFISAKHEEKNDDKDDNRFIRKERSFSSCSRSFAIGKDVDENNVKAKMENGVLTINIPKAEKADEHCITIE